VIGKGGATIRAITEETGATIEIEDDGTVRIAASDGDITNAAIKRIEDITRDVEAGQVYEGTVARLADFGALLPSLLERMVWFISRKLLMSV